MRMVPFFLFRPFIGAAFGFFAYAALFSGTLITLGSANRPSLAEGNGAAQLLGLIAVGFLFGLFSKTLHDKLRESFKAFVNAPSTPGKKAKADARAESDPKPKDDEKPQTDEQGEKGTGIPEATKPPDAS